MKNFIKRIEKRLPAQPETEHQRQLSGRLAQVGCGLLLHYFRRVQFEI